MVIPAEARACSALRARWPGAAHEDDPLGDVRADLGAVLAEDVERDVVGAGDMLRLELARGSDVEDAGVRSLGAESHELSRGEHGGNGDGSMGLLGLQDAVAQLIN